MLSFFLDISVVFIRLFLYSSLLQLTTLDAADVPKIQTDIGQFEGKILNFGGKGQVHAFYGLPFAEPPERFEVNNFQI
jgi:hypothetical protein